VDGFAPRARPKSAQPQQGPSSARHFRGDHSVGVAATVEVVISVDADGWIYGMAVDGKGLWGPARNSSMAA